MGSPTKSASACSCPSTPQGPRHGPGLSIAAKIVQEHGGSLRAEANSPRARASHALASAGTASPAQPF